MGKRRKLRRKKFDAIAMPMIYGACLFNAFIGSVIALLDDNFSHLEFICTVPGTLFIGWVLFGLFWYLREKL